MEKGPGMQCSFWLRWSEQRLGVLYKDAIQHEAVLHNKELSTSNCNEIDTSCPMIAFSCIYSDVVDFRVKGDSVS